MHPTTYHQLAVIKQGELLREAANDRLAREAKAASRATRSTGDAGHLAGLTSAVSSLMNALRPVKHSTLGSAKPSAV